MASSILFYCEPEQLTFNDNHTHFLNTCSMCKKPLELNDDVFMYQGISAFCSEDCRQCQIEIDNPPRRKRTYNLPAARQHWRPSSGSTAAATAESVRTGVATAA